MAVKINDSETILFIGDSITDCSRGSDQFKPLGWGYVRLFADLLVVREPEKKIKVINKGIGGHSVADLRDRWSHDVLSYKPDWLSIKTGINDLHQNLRGEDPDYLSPESFRKIYDQLLTLTREKLPDCQFLLIDPFFLTRGDDIEDSFRAEVLKVLPAYLKVIKELSEKHSTRHVPTHQLFQEQLKLRHPDDFAPEPVHPHPTGHLLIAESVYKALST